MAQITSGIRQVLASPLIYDVFQGLMGANIARRHFIGQDVCAQSGMKVLDIGCGTARILDHLPPVEYHGFDLSPAYISAAQERYAERGQFKVGLVEEATIEHEHSYDLVLAMGLLHHLDDEQALALMRTAKKAMKQGGRLVTIDPVFSRGQSRIARFLIERDRGQNVRSTHEYYELADSVFSGVRGVTRHRAWIPYTHFIMECSNA